MVFKHKKTRDGIKPSPRLLKFLYLFGFSSVRATKTKIREHQRQEPDAHGNNHMKGMQYVLGYEYHTQGMI